MKKKLTNKERDEIITSVPGCLVVDAKCLFDSLCRSERSGLGMPDKRSAIEALSLRQGLHQTSTLVRWVHSLAMIADGLTKDGDQAREVTLKFATDYMWRLVHDEKFTSARRHKAAGMNTDPVPDEQTVAVPGDVPG